MRLILSSLATAVLAMLASAAPTVIASEVTTDLPARFAMYVVTEEARVNGLRVLFGEGSNLFINMNIDNEFIRPIDGVFLNNKARIALDPIVHNLNTTAGAYHVLIYPFVAQVRVRSEAQQALAELDSVEYPYLKALPGKWVQDGSGLLRHLGEDGVVEPNGLRLCGVSTSVYAFWWDDVPYLNCAVAEFKVVPL